MTAINNGGAAFPTVGQHNGNGDFIVWPEPGMSLRQYYAGQAMTAVISLIGIPSDPNEPDDLWNEEIAKQCVGLADAMIKALET